MRKLLGLIVEIGEPAIISAIVSSVVAIVILTVRSLITSLTDGVETFPQFRKTASGIP
ncbi:MAG TPA: hypothetical protein VFZ55_05840 [Nitrososphaera sp.]